jgi:asparagine synthetase B (glutamine-hydrolysing)
MVFNGDGSDELFGSYLYFYNAPNEQEFEDEVERPRGAYFMMYFAATEVLVYMDLNRGHLF